MDNSDRDRSSSPGYIFDGHDIPDAQYEKDFSAFIDEALIPSQLEDEGNGKEAPYVKHERGVEEDANQSGVEGTVTEQEEREEEEEADDEEDEEEDYDDWEADIPLPVDDKRDEDFEPEELKERRERAKANRQPKVASRRPRSLIKTSRTPSVAPRSFSRDSGSSGKRAADFSNDDDDDDGAVARPVKRTRGNVNLDYLDLLNADIRDAAQRTFLAADEDSIGLREGQVGLTIWTVKEKQVFFDAVARLGSGDLPGISTCLPRKSVVEVDQYLTLLCDAIEQRNQTYNRPLVQVADLPAAIELSQECVEALDDAANVISKRQEEREERREEKRWGRGCWTVDRRLARRLDARQYKELQAHRGLDFAELFDVPTWLRLSARVFMNSADDHSSWTSVGTEPPKIWTTALDDFHSLAVSITKRLVQTTLFIAMSRIRTKKVLEPRTHDVVRKEDVAAAISALNLESKRHKFWKGAARRLNLNVVGDRNVTTDDEENSDDDDAEQTDGEHQPLSFDEVEEYLAHDENPNEAPEEDFRRRSTVSVSDSEIEDSESDGESPVDDPELPDAKKNNDLFKSLLRTDPSIRQESKELFDYSAANVANTYSNKLAVARRIVTERQQEYYADECDRYNARLEEKAMWEMLGQPDPRAGDDPVPPKAIPRTHLSIQRLLAPGMHWRKGLKYYNEWETLPYAEGKDPTEEEISEEEITTEEQSIAEDVEMDEEDD